MTNIYLRSCIIQSFSRIRNKCLSYLEHKSLVQRTLSQRYTCITERAKQNKDHVASKTRSSRPVLFYKKGVVKKFSNWGLQLRLRPATLLRKRLWHRFFPVIFIKFLRTSFFIEHLSWVLLKNSFSHAKTVK